MVVPPLFERFPNPEDLAKASFDEVYQYVKIRMPEPGRFVLENRYTAYNLNEMVLEATILFKGKHCPFFWTHI